MYDDALPRYEQALAIAKGVASLFEEARALEGLGRCQRLNGRDAEAIALLSQSLEIYQRVGSPNAQRAAALREFDV
jgi:tetratricopeptide (TPR) repeat protein